MTGRRIQGPIGRAAAVLAAALVAAAAGGPVAGPSPGPLQAQEAGGSAEPPGSGGSPPAAADTAGPGAVPLSPDDATPIAEAFADADGDFVVDRLGDTVTVAGRATIATGVLHTTRFATYLQDGTDGVRTFADRMDQSVEAGDRVVARGVVDQYRGQNELDVLEYRVVERGGPVPAPTRLEAPDAADLEAHEGELVTLEGMVTGRGENEGGRYVRMLPSDGERPVELFAAQWRARPVDLAGLDAGDRIEVTGLLAQYDPEPPYNGDYQLDLRAQEDLRRTDLVLGLSPERRRTAGYGLLLLVVGGALVWGWRERRGRRSAGRRYRMLFDQNLAGVFHTTVDGEIVDCNPAWAHLYGYESPEAAREGRAWDHYVDLADREAYLEVLRREGEVRDYEHRHRTREGEEIRVLENARLVEDAGDGREHIVGTVVDLTERVEAEREQQAAEERYRLLFERNVAGAFRSTLDGTLLEVNRAFADMLGYGSPEEMEGRPATDLYADPERRDELMATLEDEGQLGNEELVLERQDGSPVWVLENSFLAEDPATGETVNIGTVTEITEQVEAERAMEELAHRDPLTGLPNRRQLEESVPRLLEQADRRGQSVAVVYIDLDGFKEVNDRWGHAVGDEVLQRVAHRLEECVREEDLPARIGGDEFVVVLPDQPSHEEACRSASRGAERCFRQPLEAEGRELSLSASVGVAVYPTDAEDFETLVNHADRAMYRASRNGSLVEYYDREVDRPYGGKLERRERIGRALEAGEILGYRQPIYALAGDRPLTWMELLARWERPDEPVLEGVDLIPEVRSAGLLPRLDLAMLRQAAGEAARWQEGTVASNLSAETLAREELVEEVRTILRERPEAEGRLAVEVTEHAALREPDRSRRVLEALSELGVAVVLDDFGTGYSSLSHLETLPVHTVKLDFSLVQRIGKGGRAEALVEGVIDLAHSLDAHVVAEGVEREDQLRWLLRSDCDAVQGYLLGRPTPPDRPMPATLADARTARGPGPEEGPPPEEASDPAAGEPPA